MKIERPDWSKTLHIRRQKTLCSCNGGPYEYMKSVDWGSLQDWFDREVEPINKMLSEGETVYVRRRVKGSPHNLICTTDLCPGDVETALLINRQQIKKETAEDILRDVLTRWGGGHDDFEGYADLEKRALAVLEDK